MDQTLSAKGDNTFTAILPKIDSVIIKKFKLKGENNVKYAKKPLFRDIK